MNQTMATMTAVAMTVAAHGAVFFSADGLVTDKTSGWRFEASGAKGGETFTFTNAQGSVKKLFEWAMERPVPEEE